MPCNGCHTEAVMQRRSYRGGHAEAVMQRRSYRGGHTKAVIQRRSYKGGPSDYAHHRQKTVYIANSIIATIIAVLLFPTNSLYPLPTI